MENIKNRNIGLVLAAIFVIFCISFVTALRIWNWTTEKEQKISRQKVLALIADLKPKMTKAQVRQIFDEHQWASFREEDNEIRIWTKPQPLATNWIVRLFFEDDVLMAVKYGTANNNSKRPEGAPPDISFRGVNSKGVR